MICLVLNTGLGCLWSQEFRGGFRFRVFAIIGDEGGLAERKNQWTSLFDVEDPRTKVPQYKGKFLDVFQALELARYDIQYCDWKARQDVRQIMLLHEKVNKNTSDIYKSSTALSFMW